MKIGGKEVKGPAEEVLVLPRLDGDIVFRARAVLDMDEFNKQCPLPKAPGRLTKDGFRSNVDDPTYKELLNKHSELRLAFLIIKSLEPSQIEWELVKADEPSTWLKWSDDFLKAGFSDVEVQRIMVCVMQANSLDESKLKAAREVFLLGQGVESELSSGQNTEQASTQPGEGASA